MGRMDRDGKNEQNEQNEQEWNMSGRVGAWLSRIRGGERLPGKQQLLILFLTGVLLMVAVIPFPEAGEEGAGEADEAAEESAPSGEGKAGYRSDEAYEAYLEEKTAKLLGQVDGVGEVTVMITLRSGSQKVVEKDSASSSQKTEEEDSSGGTRVTEDRSSEQTSIYRQDTDGSQSPYVTMELLPQIEGVVVIAEGGDQPVTVREITEAVQALFDVEAHKIKVMKRADT